MSRLENKAEPFTAKAGCFLRLTITKHINFMPNITFGFIVCSYLPGLIVSLALFFSSSSIDTDITNYINGVKKFNEVINIIANNNSINTSQFINLKNSIDSVSEASKNSQTQLLISYFLISPLLFGLLLDGIRHLIEMSIYFFDKSKIARFICLNFLWQKINNYHLDEAIPQGLTKEIYEKHITHYHLYEFGYNTFISSFFFVIILYMYPENNIAYNYFWELICITIFGFLAGWAYKKENDKLLDTWSKKKRADTLDKWWCFWLEKEANHT